MHRLVAKVFVSNPENYNQVDHINGNCLDNRAVNLRWVNNYINSRNPNTTRCKVIYQYNLENEFIREWESVNTAAKTLGIDNRNISGCARKNSEINSLKYCSHSFKWSFKIIKS